MLYKVIITSLFGCMILHDIVCVILNMCVYMYICMLVSVRRCDEVPIFILRVCRCVCTCVYVCLCLYQFVHVHINKCVCEYMCAFADEHTHAHWSTMPWLTRHCPVSFSDMTCHCWPVWPVRQSCRWTSPVSRMNEPCISDEPVMSQMEEPCRRWMSPVALLSVSCCIQEWAMPHIWMSHFSLALGMRHAAHMNESYFTCTGISHATRTNEPCFTCMWMIHVTHMKESFFI